MRLIGDLVFAGFGQIKNLRIENVAADPATPQDGQVWYNTTDKVYRGYNGTDVVTFASGGNTQLLQDEIDGIESAVGLGTDGAFTAPAGSNYLGATTTVKEGLVALDTAAKSAADAAAAAQGEVDALEGVVADLQTEVDAVETAVGLNANGTFTAPAGTNYLGTTTTVKGMAVALDTQIKTVADGLAQELLDRAADVQAEEDRAVLAEASKVSKAGDTMTGNLAMGGTHTVTGLAAPVDPTDALRKIDLENALAGLDFQADVLGTEAEFAGVAGRYIFIDGSTFVAGATGASANDIVVVDTEGNVIAVAYDVSVAGSGALTWDATGQVWMRYDGAVWSTFGGLGDLNAGVGLSKSGNVINVNLGAGVAQLPTDEVGLDLYATGGLILTENGTDASTGTNAQLSVKLDGATLTVGAGGLKVSDTTIARITTVEGGLAQEILDREAAVQGVADDLADEVLRATTKEGELQTEVDAIEAAVGLGTDGTLVAFAGTNFIDAAATIAAAAVALDTAVKTVNDRLTGSQFVYDGSVAATSHVVNHGLGVKYGNVTVIDSNDKVVIPDSITFNTANQLTVEFISAVTCKVVYSAPKA